MSNSRLPNKHYDSLQERNAFANSENYNHPQTFEEIQASEHQAQMPEYPSQMSDQMVQGKSRKYAFFNWPNWALAQRPVLIPGFSPQSFKKCIKIQSFLLVCK